MIFNETRKIHEINVSINDCDAEVWHTPGSPAKFELMWAVSADKCVNQKGDVQASPFYKNTGKSGWLYFPRNLDQNLQSKFSVC